MTPLRSLLGIAVIAGVVWRLEVEWRGWAGLVWVGHFHLAVPVAVGLFLAWVARWVDAASGRHRVAIVGALSAYALVAVPATKLSLEMAYGRWAMASWAEWLTLWWWLLAPTTMAGLLVVCRAAPGWRRWAVSQAGFVLALPVATAFLAWFPQHGHNMLHTIKSGLLMPLLVMALGAGVPVRARPAG